MPVYFGIRQSDPKQKISPIILERGLNYLRVAPSLLRFIGLHQITQPGYASYASVLPAAIHAAITNETTLVSAEGYPIITPLTSCFPTPPTNLVFNFTTDRITEAEQDFLNDLTAVRHKLDGRKGAYWSISSATPEIVRSIKTTFPNTLNLVTPSPVQTVNVHAYNYMILVLRIFSGFFITHSYPAFSGPSEALGINSMAVTEFQNKRKRITMDNSPRTSARMEGSADATTNRQIDITDETIVEDTVRLFKVKPSPTTNPWGPLSNLPNGEGLYFPFVEDLAAGDSDAVYNCISRWFVKCLGLTMNEQSFQLNALKSAVGVFKDTTFGHLLAHMATVISIAIPAQCRVYPIFADDVYDGAAIIGSMWSLGQNGALTYPVSSENLKIDIANCSSHSSATTAIMNILRGGNVMHVDSTKIKSMWHLHQLCSEASLTEPNKLQVIRHAAHLNFPIKRWRVHGESIHQMFDLISGDREFDDSAPISSTALFSTSNIELALSCFGYETISFLIDNGTPYSVTPTSKPPPHISVKQVPLARAVLDFDTMCRNQEIRYARPQLSKAYKYREFSGNVEKGDIWSCIVKAVGTTPSNPIEPTVTGLDVSNEW